MAIVNGRYLSSLVTDPADGRIPALTQAAKARVADRAAALARSDGPEDRTLSLKTDKWPDRHASITRAPFRRRVAERMASIRVRISANSLVPRS